MKIALGLVFFISSFCYGQLKEHEQRITGVVQHRLDNNPNKIKIITNDASVHYIDSITIKVDSVHQYFFDMRTRLLGRDDTTVNTQIHVVVTNHGGFYSLGHYQKEWISDWQQVLGSSNWDVVLVGNKVKVYVKGEFGKKHLWVYGKK